MSRQHPTVPAKSSEGHPLDRRTRTILRRGGAVLVAVGLVSSIGVYFGHHWFHDEFLPLLGVSPALGDSIGGFVIILVAYMGQRAVSMALFHDTELGSTQAALRLERANQGLQTALGELDRLAGTDTLTGAWNRRRLEEAVRGEMDRLARYSHPLSLLVIDVDFFKTINDRHGHGTGDRVLVELASLLEATLRPSDSLARWGGEEFVVLCPNATLATATLLAERLRHGVAEMKFAGVGRITASIGIAECLPGETWEHWFHRADAALYLAKSSGRNQVRAAPETPARESIGEKVAARFLRLVWHGIYESGHATIDHEHQALFDQANSLLAVMLAECPPAEVSAMVDAFIREIALHFSNEEAIIAMAGYPDAGAHAKVHRELLAEAVGLADLFRAGALEVDQLFHFLAHDVVAKHLLGADREFFAYVNVQH